MSVNCSSSGGGESSNGGGGGGGGGGGPCGACKFLRRKCLPGCIFAPYFDSEQGPTHFAAVHKVFGASNVSKLILSVPANKRPDAVVTICYEAQARLRDPVYGCVAHISALQHQVVCLQAELSYLQGHLASSELPQPPPVPPLSQSQAAIAISPASTSTAASTSDLSSLFDPMAQNPYWAIQQRTMGQRQYVGNGPSSMGELLDRHGSPTAASLPSSLSLSK